MFLSKISFDDSRLKPLRILFGGLSGSCFACEIESSGILSKAFKRSSLLAGTKSLISVPFASPKRVISSVKPSNLGPIEKQRLERMFMAPIVQGGTRPPW